jgi:hypothetical protein
MEYLVMARLASFATTPSDSLTMPPAPREFMVVGWEFPAAIIRLPVMIATDVPLLSR